MCFNIQVYLQFPSLYSPSNSIFTNLVPHTPFYVVNVPFVLGTSPSLPATLLVAILIATARALNALSAL